MNPYLVKSLLRGWSLRGRWRLAAALGLSVGTLPEGDTITTADGRSFRLKRDGMYFRLFLDDSYHRDETTMFRLVCRPGDVVADIGANFGWYTTLFASCAGPNGAVHAFEPSPTVFDELKYHVGINGFVDRVRLNDCALGANEESKAELYTFEHLPHGLASLSSLGRNDAEKTAVRVTTLDRYAADKGIKFFDLIKIDVEGGEMDVLQGAHRVLASTRPPLLLIEMNYDTAGHFGYRPIEILQHLVRTAAYDSFWVFRSNRLLQLPTLSDFEHGEMVLCAKRSAHAQKLDEAVLRSPSSSAPPHSVSSPSNYPRTPQEVCRVCGSEQTDFALRTYDDRYGMPDEFDIHHCPLCESYFLQSPIAPGAVQRLYQEYYAPQSASAAKKHGRAATRLRQGLRRTEFWSFCVGGLDLAPHIRPGERVLEIGCGFGGHRDAVYSQGGTWVGIDADPKVTNYISSTGGEVFLGTVEEFARLGTEGFDLILMSQVLEHTADPVSMLQAARNCLRASGRIAVSTPNAASRFRQRLGRRWIHWHVPFHVTLLSPRSLRLAARKAGLKLERLYTVTPPSWYLCQRSVRDTSRGSPNKTFRLPFSPRTWAALAPLLRTADLVHQQGSGDAIIAVLTPEPPSPTTCEASP